MFLMKIEWFLDENEVCWNFPSIAKKKGEEVASSSFFSVKSWTQHFTEAKYELKYPCISFLETIEKHYELANKLKLPNTVWIW